MARKIVVIQDSEAQPILLSETSAANELQLQEQMKTTPDLLPIDEFGMVGPLLIVGRETTLPSGAADLLAVARTGELLVIEFKTGPQNADFRHVLAQLLDYGSDLWGMTYADFEATVVRPYFSSSRCTDSHVRDVTSLDEAAKRKWEDLTAEDLALFRDHLSTQLQSGGFHYVVVAQRFRSTMERTVAYLNTLAPSARFYAVELVRFESATLAAYEARTVLKPDVTTTSTAPSLNEQQFLTKVTPETYQAAVGTLLSHCRRLGLHLEWGAKGVSIRVLTVERTEPISVAWLYPPGVSGWMGLTDLSLGYDAASAPKYPRVAHELHDYVGEVSSLAGAERVKPQWMEGYHVAPQHVVDQVDTIVELLTRLIQRLESVS